MLEQILSLIGQYKSKGILIDTNILLLYFVGSFDPELIPRFKRTIQFTIEDYRTLRILIYPFKRLLTTPNILTEVSNLSSQLNENAKTPYFQLFAERINEMEENYIASANAAAQEKFPKIGLTDAGIFELSENQYLVLTDDFRLSQSLQSRGIDVINFNHVRILGW